MCHYFSDRWNLTDWVLRVRLCTINAPSKSAWVVLLVKYCLNVVQGVTLSLLMFDKISVQCSKKTENVWLKHASCSWKRFNRSSFLHLVMYFYFKEKLVFLFFAPAFAKNLHMCTNVHFEALQEKKRFSAKAKQFIAYHRKYLSVWV